MRCTNHLAMGLLAVVLGLASGASASTLSFRRLGHAAPGEQPTALAHAAGTLAVGGLRSVWIGPPGAPRRVSLRGPVVDVALLPGGALLAGTPSGLYRIEAEGAPVRVLVAAGEASGDVRRIAVAGDLVAVATRGGVHLRRAGGRWRRLAELPLGEATLAVLESTGEGDTLWASIAGALWRVRVEPEGVGFASAERVRIPFVPHGAAVLDVHAEGGAATVVYAGSAWALRDASNGAWRVLRPVLSPGAEARRLRRALGRWWLATDAGLLHATDLEGPWTRAPEPVGRLPAAALAGSRDTLFVATRQGVFAGSEERPSPGAAFASDVPSALRVADPTIAEVHRAVLAHVDLGSEALRDQRRRVQRRGWLPVVSVRAGHDEGRSRRRDYDQSYVSGATRDLHDYQLDDERDLELSLTLAWDLGDAVYHPEEVDVSRETRAVVELRDDVLDEVTQLYFERRRLLAERAGLTPGDPAAATLTLRAEELAAGIDAWTGGWFGRRVN